MSKRGKDIRTFFQPSSSQASTSTPVTAGLSGKLPRDKVRQSPRHHASSTTPRTRSDSPALPGPIPDGRVAAGVADSMADLGAARSPGLQFSSLPSSPQTPQKKDTAAARKQRGPLTRDDEIKGSDEESDDLGGDDSDSSVESLSAIFGLSKPSPKYERPDIAARGDAVTTPQAKRVASIGTLGGGHKSPMTLQQRLRRGMGGGSSFNTVGGGSGRPAAATKHKFDMKALLQHTKENERAEESARRAQELIDMPEVDEDDDKDHSGSGSDTKPGGKITSNLREKARVVMQGSGDGEDDAGEKLVRAIDRTKSKPTRRCCYFFSPGVPLSTLRAKTKRAHFPLAAATGRWEFLADPTTREQSFMHHIPQALIMRGVKMPKEILTWLIGELCLESNAQTRLRYTDVLACCGKRAGRLLSTKRLYSMLEALGGPRVRGTNEKFLSAMEQEEAYVKRDWGPLITYLRTLVHLAPYLRRPEEAVLLLLRMSLDPICGTIVRHEHAMAVEALVQCLPQESMPQLAIDVCTFITHHTTDVVLQTQAVNSIPKTTPRLRDLWRDVARGILFGKTVIDTTIKDNETLSLDLLLERIEQPDFSISQTTDFEELKSLVTLLDSAIGNAAFLQAPHEQPEPVQQSTATATTAAATVTSPTTITVSTLPPKPPPFFAPNATKSTAASASKDEAVTRFDTQIDTLTRRIELLTNKIHDNNSPERKEAKTALDALAKRLAYSVRTKPPAKMSIFDMAGLRGDTTLMRRIRAAEEERIEGPRQRDFMKNWALNGSSKEAEKDPRPGRLNAVLVDGETGLSHDVS